METLYTGAMSNKATSLDTEPPRKYYYSIVLKMTFNSVILRRSEYAEICQLSAVQFSGYERSFDRYALPQYGISPQASQGNKLTVVAR